MGDNRLLARAGELEVRLASSAREIAAAQALRYRVFFEEGGAQADAASRLARRDICRFDEVCDHVVARWTRAAAKSSAPIGCCGGRSRSGDSASTARPNSTSAR